MCTLTVVREVRGLPREHRALFDELDADGDGTLTVEEVAAGLAVSNPAVTLEGVKQMVDYADADKNGKVDFEEFSQVILLSGMYNTISVATYGIHGLTV